MAIPYILTIAQSHVDPGLKVDLLTTKKDKTLLGQNTRLGQAQVINANNLIMH